MSPPTAALTSTADVDEGGVRLAAGFLDGSARVVVWVAALGLAYLATVPAVALCGGAALYLLGHIAFLYRTTGHVFRRRTIGAVALLALVPAALALPALAARALVSVVCALVVAYEAVRDRTSRVTIRHPDLAGWMIDAPPARGLDERELGYRACGRTRSTSTASLGGFDSRRTLARASRVVADCA